MRVTAWNCPDAWWIYAAIAVTVLVAGSLLLWRHRYLQHRALLDAERDAHDSESMALQDSILQSSQGLILRLEAIARNLPPDHPTRRDISKALDRAERVLANGLRRAQHLRKYRQRPGRTGSSEES